ncbi:MAG: hypothetical protein JW768_13995 [Chitinispirillaceae bacterium]|nr:hypothetical protein [Chitinispirillaceae bacterium]
MNANRRRAVECAVYGVVLPYCFFFMAGTGCDYIPTGAVLTDTTFSRFEAQTIHRMEEFHLFNTKEFGRAFDFRGTHVCSVRVNGTLDSTAHDSVYARITCRKDTLLTINDSTYGLPLFVAADIASWKTCGYHFNNYESTFLGRLFHEAIDSSLFAALRTCLDSLQDPSDVPLPEYVSAVVTALNDAIADVYFFHNHREELMSAVLSEKLDTKLDRLMTEGIFIDSSCTPKSPLTIYEKAAVQWFVRDLLSMKSVDVIPQAGMNPIFARFASSQRIHKIDFTQCSDPTRLAEKTVTRFFAFNKNGEEQIAFTEYDGSLETVTGTIEEKTLLPFPYITGMNWSVTPVFMADIPLIPAGMTSLMVQPGRAFSYYDPNESTKDTARYSLRLYYPINGAYRENGVRFTFIGSVVLTFTYNRLFTLPYDPATVTDWNTEVFVRRSKGDGAVIETKEATTLHAGH